MKKDRAEEVLRAAWLKAWAAGEVTVQFKDELGAKRSQFALYRAVKAAREGLDDDRELCKAANGCMLARAGTKVMIMRRDRMDETLAIAEAIGLDMETVVQPVDSLDADAQASAARMLERLKAGTL